MNESHSAVDTLLDDIERRHLEIGAAMAEAIIREVGPIQQSAANDPTFKPRFDGFCQLHVLTFVQITRAGTLPAHTDFPAIRQLAERRADDAFPLAALMEGLRVGHRVFNRRINQLGSGWNTPAATLLWITTRLVEYMDALGAELGEAYRARQALSAGRTDLLRREVLEDLVEGRYTSRPDASLMAASLGFQPDEQYAVAVLIAAGGGQATQALAADVTRVAFANTRFRFVVVRRDEVVGIFRRSETTGVVNRVLGADVRAGISTVCRGIGEVARGYWEAVRAIHFTSEDEPCIDLACLGPLRYLEFNADSVARQLATQFLGELRPGVLADTLLAYVDSGLNAKLTAERLGLHLNTIHNRLERIADVLKRPRLSPNEWVEAATALRICSR